MCVRVPHEKSVESMWFRVPMNSGVEPSEYILRDGGTVDSHGSIQDGKGLFPARIYLSQRSRHGKHRPVGTLFGNKAVYRPMVFPFSSERLEFHSPPASEVRKIRFRCHIVSIRFVRWNPICDKSNRHILEWTAGFPSPAPLFFDTGLSSSPYLSISHTRKI